MSSFFENYVSRLKLLLDSVDIRSVNKIVETIEKTHDAKSNIYIMGNGGSAATASHMVNDLGVGLRRRGLMNFNAPKNLNNFFANHL